MYTYNKQTLVGVLMQDSNTKHKKTLKPINRASTVDKIIDRIVKAIARGEFKVGEKLPNEFELMAELDVGRNSLREAMRVLSTLGVVEVKRGDGTYVCDHIAPTAFDPIIYSIIFKENRDPALIELRSMLESMVLRSAINKIKPDDNYIDTLENIISEIRCAYENGDKKKAALLDYQFHVTITEICNNPYLSKIVNGIYEIFMLSLVDTIDTEEQFLAAESYHIAILDCLRNKKDAEAESVINKSMTFWLE
jgi:DNA-binding FadR family transcriptional regulator